MTQPTSNPVNTKKITGRRELHFTSLDQALADARKVADGAQAGNLLQLGNWAPAQCFNHLSTWVGYAFDGVPKKPPLLFRMFGPLIKGRVLRGPMPAGLRLPKVQGGTYAFEQGPIDAAMKELEKAYDRIKREAPSRPNPIFGSLTHKQWTQLHCRHAELHLSFYVLAK